MTCGVRSVTKKAAPKVAERRTREERKGPASIVLRTFVRLNVLLFCAGLGNSAATERCAHGDCVRQHGRAMSVHVGCFERPSSWGG